MYGGIPPDRSGPWPTDTWRLQDQKWTRIATDGPPGRGRTALAYDSKRRQVVLFGGVSAPPGPDRPQTFFNDTWIWEAQRWRRVAEGGPRGRYAHGMVYDERAGVVLLYGGAAAHRDAPLSDMWQWDGARWTEIPLTGATPGHRYQPVMVYDRARDRTVLVGGLARSERHLGVGRPGLAADQASPLAVRRCSDSSPFNTKARSLEDDTKKLGTIHVCVLARRPRRRFRRAAARFNADERRF